MLYYQFLKTAEPNHNSTITTAGLNQKCYHPKKKSCTHFHAKKVGLPAKKYLFYPWEQINPSSSFIPDTAPFPFDIGEHHHGEKTPPTVLAPHLHQPREEQLGSREFKQTLLTSIFEKVKEVPREPMGLPCIPSHKTQADTFESSMIPGQEVGKDTKCSGSANTINTIVDCNEDGCDEENRVSMGVENKVSTAPSVCTNDKLLDIEKACVDVGGLCSIHQTVITYRKVKPKKWKDRGKGRGFGWVPTNIKKFLCGSQKT